MIFKYIAIAEDGLLHKIELEEKWNPQEIERYLQILGIKYEMLPTNPDNTENSHME